MLRIISQLDIILIHNTVRLCRPEMTGLPHLLQNNQPNVDNLVGLQVQYLRILLASMLAMDNNLTLSL